MLQHQYSYLVSLGALAPPPKLWIELRAFSDFLGNKKGI